MRRLTMAAMAGLVVAAAGVAGQQEGRIPSVNRSDTGITHVPGIKVGHFTRTERPTGCTVILAEYGAVGGVDVRGSAPGTIETDLLNPVNLVPHVHAVFLSGGSAFGLDVAAGVRKYLHERNIGFETRVAKVPIVPGAILFDLGVGNRPDIWPTAECGYRAAAAATNGPVPEGNVGAGAGATVGKSAGAGGPMKGGVGTSHITLSVGRATELVIGAIVAVNAVGDVIDPATGQIVAGVRTPSGEGLADARKLLRTFRWTDPQPGQNTTIGVVATNARLTKAQATKMAQMAQDGLARTIYPAHTMGDGDVVFAMATGALDYDDVSRIGALAADVMAEAILRAVRAATSIPGYPAARDIHK
jgi:L-aminopeptidase/D-esterase-like protein